MNTWAMAGAYSRGDGATWARQSKFRSRLGVSRPVGPVCVGLHFEHKSNGGVAELNPGVETCSSRWGAVSENPTRQ